MCVLMFGAIAWRTKTQWLEENGRQTAAESGGKRSDKKARALSLNYKPDGQNQHVRVPSLSLCLKNASTSDSARYEKPRELKDLKAGAARRRGAASLSEILDLTSHMQSRLGTKLPLGSSKHKSANGDKSERIIRPLGDAAVGYGGDYWRESATKSKSYIAQRALPQIRSARLSEDLSSVISLPSNNRHHHQRVTPSTSSTSSTSSASSSTIHFTLPTPSSTSSAAHNAKTSPSRVRGRRPESPECRDAR